jgi:hypothetical protein
MAKSFILKMRGKEFVRYSAMIREFLSEFSRLRAVEEMKRLKGEDLPLPAATSLSAESHSITYNFP